MNSFAYRLGKLQAGVGILLQRVEKINSCHESSSGKFCSTGGGGGGGKAKKTIIRTKGGANVREEKAAAQAALDSIPEKMKLVKQDVYIGTRSLEGITGGPTASGYFSGHSGTETGTIEVTAISPSTGKRNLSMVAKTAVHEYAHAVDYKLGGAKPGQVFRSDSSDFRSVFEAERANVPSGKRAKNFWGTPHREAFAEVYSSLTGTPSSTAGMENYYPQTRAFVRTLFK